MASVKTDAAVTQKLRDLIADGSGSFSKDQLLNELSNLEEKLGLMLTDPTPDEKWDETYGTESL